MRQKENPLITVIVPVYNAEKTVEKCICSIISQIYTNFECIIVDDGSVDDSFEVILELIKHDKRFVLIHQNNLGVSAARNRGLSVANGEYISFVDPDDWVREDFLEKLVFYSLKNHSDIVVCDYSKVCKKDSLFIYELNCVEDILMPRDAIKEVLLGNGLFCGHVCDKLFSKKVIEKIRFNENVHCYEDLLFCINAFLYANNVTYLHCKLYSYFQNENSILHRGYSEKYCSSFIAIEKIDELLSKDIELNVLIKRKAKTEAINQGWMLLWSNTENKDELVKRVMAQYRKHKNYKMPMSAKMKIKSICIGVRFGWVS